MKENEPSKPNTRGYIKELTQQFKFIQVDPTKKHQYVTTNFELSPIRLTSDGHFPEWRKERSSSLCCNKNRSSCFKDYHTHKDNNIVFNVWDLIKSSMKENEPSKPNTRGYIKELTQQFKFIQVDPTKKHQYVTTNFELSPIRLTSDGHFPEWRKERSSSLCCNKNRSSCFKDYHTHKDNNIVFNG
ncbi:hypothetical protein Glove_242g166 [Diversispora epigaea]|uniref:Uncharacterized protein n=1 Tax=Diversispora epigaea TaxID=1348612 RepID=A0A397IAD8_9GLOM|nr:hypothetical protein Glove_242g166 [Diversispora epigaea]